MTGMILKLSTRDRFWLRRWERTWKWSFSLEKISRAAWSNFEDCIRCLIMLEHFSWINSFILTKINSYFLTKPSSSNLQNTVLNPFPTFWTKHWSWSSSRHDQACAGIHLASHPRSDNSQKPPLTPSEQKRHPLHHLHGLLLTASQHQAVEVLHEV